MQKTSLLLLITVLLACEDVVDLKLPEAPPAVVVDAWLTDKEEQQIIKLTYSQPYFDSSLPEGITGATVVVTDDKGQVFNFLEEGEGDYIWDPASVPYGFDETGTDYTLQVEVNGERFQAFSSLNRVPAIDSIRFVKEEEDTPFQASGYYAEFVAQDFEGEDDSYWIKAYKNGIPLNRPFELKIAYDAGFNPGGIDGTVFIQPIQDINVFNDDLDELVPFVSGDSLYVEIHSITNEAFFCLQQVQIQTQRDGGFDEIFAEPLENVSTNIIKIDDTDTQVVGFFNVAKVSGLGRKLE